MIKPDKTVRTTCPYCGVGCQMNLHLKDKLIYRVSAPFDAAPNYGMLCVKGRFGTDYVNHPGRVKEPLIRTNRAAGRSAPPEWKTVSWDEALDFVADELVRIANDLGGDSIAKPTQAPRRQTRITMSFKSSGERYLRPITSITAPDSAIRDR